MKLKSFDNFVNEGFEEETTPRGFKVKKFKLSDVLPTVKLINMEMDDLDDGEETGFRFSAESTYDKPFEFDGAKYLVTDLNIKYEGDDRYGEFGWIVLKDGEPVYIIQIYEPHNYFTNTKRGLLTFEGHEEIINLWLDNGEFDHKHTR